MKVLIVFITLFVSMLANANKVVLEVSELECVGLRTTEKILINVEQTEIKEGVLRVSGFQIHNGPCIDYIRRRKINDCSSGEIIPPIKSISKKRVTRFCGVGSRITEIGTKSMMPYHL